MAKVVNCLRRLLMICLNFIKMVLFFCGVLGMIIFCLAVDSPGEVGDMCLKYFFYSALTVVTSVAIEMFVVHVLLKKHERLNVLFDLYPNRNVEPLIGNFVYVDEPYEVDDEIEEYEERKVV